MSAGFDVVVIGAGHNGLTAAVALAKDGRRTLVVERAETIGGLLRRETFHPGYRDAGLLHDTSAVRPAIAERLELSRHGLEFRSRPGEVVLLGNPGESSRLTHDDGRLAGIRERIAAWRPVVRAWLDSRPPDLVETPRLTELLPLGVRLRRLGRDQMLELLRVPPMTLDDFLRESLDDELLMAGLALPALSGTTLGPRAPGSAANFLLHTAAAGPGLRGGGPALIRALESAARAHGVEIRTGAAVDRIVVEDGRAKAVAVGNERIPAATIVASCDPRTVFLELIDPRLVETRLIERIRAWRCRGTTARVRLALRRPLALPGSDEPFEFARLASSLDAIERASDAVKYGSVPERPVLELHQPARDTDDDAPQGHAVLSALTHFVAHDARGESPERRRATLLERVLRELQAHTGPLGDDVVAADVQLPGDIERAYGVSGGQIHHGEHALDQLLVRPAPGCTGYSTPIGGLWLAGSGSHPGGGLSCVPGFLAASAISRA